MKRVTAKFYTMSTSEGAVALAIAAAVVIAYSAWGAYVLHASAESASPQVATTSK